MNYSAAFFLLISFFLFVSPSHGQQKDSPMPNNVIFAQGGTVFVNGHLAAGLERRIWSQPNDAFHFYGGLGYGRYRAALFFSGAGPRAHISGFTGAGAHHFEISLATYYLPSTDTTPDEGGFGPDLSIGYRYMRPEGGFVFKGFVALTGVGIGLGLGF
ncbi:MAG: hypothetical protein AAFY71_27775 [Bacteroidota bacterium]